MRATGTDGASAMTGCNFPMPQMPATLPATTTLALGEEGTGHLHPFAAALAEPNPRRVRVLNRVGVPLDIVVTVAPDGCVEVEVNPVPIST